MQNDILLDIAIGASLWAKRWKNEQMRWSSLVKKLRKPVVTNETYAKFLKMSREDQQAVKDVGGYVGGYIRGGCRNIKNISHRQIICLDADFSENDVWEDITMFFPYAMLLHSTHKHSEDTPRHRILIPLSRDVGSDEYVAISRKLAQDFGMEMFDRTTFDPNRLMFWPSVSSDAKYIFEVQDGDFLNPDDVLAEYTDWTDVSSWPRAQDEDDRIRSGAKVQQDPTEKGGIVGAFCQAYTISEAIAEFLPEVYEPTQDGRYTYVLGSTASGVVTYDDMFSYSHHGTDPTSGKLCNAFDLVRLHRFGSDPEGSGTSGKSFREMEELARNDDSTKKIIVARKLDEARRNRTAEEDFGVQTIEPGRTSPEEDFGITPVEPTKAPEDKKWTDKLTVDKKGNIQNTIHNARLLIMNDPSLKGVIANNTFDYRKYITRKPAWPSVPGEYPRPITDDDYAGLRELFENDFNITSSSKIDDAAKLSGVFNCYNPVKDYLESLEWDGVERIPTLMQKYMGAPDEEYTSNVLRLSLVGAVARIFEPGCKFDDAMVLVGGQGCGKSTFVRKIGKGWSSDTISTFQGKESYEQLQGNWIIEVPELAAMKRSEIETTKAYISKQSDKFRPAYGRCIETFQRQCIFILTTNDEQFLVDTTGNRRFYPIKVDGSRAEVKITGPEFDKIVDQMWAEAVHLYRNGAKTYMDGKEASKAEEKRQQHTKVDGRADMVHAFVDMKFPPNWDQMTTEARQAYVEDPLEPEDGYYRDHFCALEIWVECFQKRRGDMKAYSAKEIYEILGSHPELSKGEGRKKFNKYGKQTFYERDPFL